MEKLNFKDMLIQLGNSKNSIKKYALMNLGGLAKHATSWSPCIHKVYSPYYI